MSLLPMNLGLIKYISHSLLMNSKKIPPGEVISEGPYAAHNAGFDSGITALLSYLSKVMIRLWLALPLNVIR